MPSPTHRSAIPTPLLKQAAMGALAVAVALMLVAQGLSQVLTLSAAFPIKAMFLFVLASLWLSTYLPGHLPQVRLGPANLVTLSRLGLAALLGGFVGEAQAHIAWPAVGIASLALALDGVDCLSFGPADLGLDMKHNPHPDLKTVDDCVRYVCRSLEGTGTVVCFRNGTPDPREKYADMGVTVFLERPPA